MNQSRPIETWQHNCSQDLLVPVLLQHLSHDAVHLVEYVPGRLSVLTHLHAPHAGQQQGSVLSVVSHSVENSWEEKGMTIIIIA